MSSMLSPPGELILLRLFPFWAKRCRNGMEFDVQPYNGILKQAVYSVFLNQGLQLHRRRKLQFSCVKSEVRPNDVEMA